MTRTARALVNNRVRSLKESATLAVMAKAQQLKAQGKDIIDLSTGEPDCDTPEHVKEGARKAIAEGKNKYTPTPGIPALREALAKKFSEENRIPTAASAVVVTNGGKHALHAVFDVLLEPGDEVIIPAPFWVSFPSMVELSGGVSVIVQTQAKDGYKLTPEALERAITKQTRALVFNSPSNPTGVAYDRAEIRALSEVLARHDIVVISDEVYERIVYGNFKFESFAAAVPELAGSTVTVNAFSKSYAMTGWRVGYATGPQEIISAMIKHQSQTTSNICSIAQYAALAALQGPTESITRMVASFDRRMDSVLGAIKAGRLPGISVANKPQGAFYLFLRIDQYLAANAGRFAGSGDFANALLEKVGLAVVPGEAFGDDKAVRISVGAADAVIDGAVERLERFLRD